MIRRRFLKNFIVLEGLDGSGKSTQIELLKEELPRWGIDSYFTREHNRNGPAGKLIEKIVNHQEKLNPVALQLLFVVDRLDHLEREVIPELEKGKLVFSDRYYWTTVAYGSRVASRNWFLQVNKYCPDPNLTIYLDVSPKVAIKRMQSRGDKATIFEKLNQLEEFQKTYYWLLKKYQGESVVVDGGKPPKQVLSDIIAILKERGYLDD